MPNLCYIIYINLCIRAFGLQTTFNDPCLVQLYIILDQNDGQVADSPLSFVLLAFFKDIPNGRMGVVLRRTKSYCSWFSTAGHLVVYFCLLHCFGLLCPKLICHLSFQALFCFF